MKDDHIYIGLGSNVGDRLKHLSDALAGIGRLPGTSILAHSSVYETTPVGYLRQGCFLNMTARLASDLSPEALLESLQTIERDLGRVRTIRWGPRVIDIDILYWGERTLSTSALRIPHPLAERRAFVMVPLCEIAPGFKAPPHMRRVDELLDNLPDRRGVQLYLSNAECATF